MQDTAKRPASPTNESMDTPTSLLNGHAAMCAFIKVHWQSNVSNACGMARGDNHAERSEIVEMPGRGVFS